MNIQQIMKSRRTKNTFLSGLLGLLVFLNSCGSSSEEKKTQAVATDATTPTTLPSKKAFYINTATNEALAEISDEGDQLVVSIGPVNLFGVLKKEDKRKYYNQNDQLRYTLKYKENDFKLNDQNEALLWKIKQYQDHIKISNNDDMNHSYRIGRPETNRIKVKRDNNDIAALRIKMDDPFTRIREKYTVRNFGNSLALGVLLIDEIPEEQKFVICAELLKKGK